VTKTPIYQLKVTLRHSRPAIWRRVEVQSTITLPRLHTALQAVMGWLDYHLHAFLVDGVRYGDLQLIEEFDGEDYWWVRLREVAPRVGSRLAYWYDWGDDWWHDLVVVAILPPDPTARYPRCVAGERATPPEDVGGIHGYAEFRRALRSPRHAEHETYLTWVGGTFDPEAFSVARANARLRGPWPVGTPPLGDR
jgi:hypothetical protein